MDAKSEMQVVQPWCWLIQNCVRPQAIDHMCDASRDLLPSAAEVSDAAKNSMQIDAAGVNARPTCEELALSQKVKSRGNRVSNLLLNDCLEPPASSQIQHPAQLASSLRHFAFSDAR